MAEQKTAYRDMFRATSLVGAGTFVSLLIALVRNKILAIVLGPAGIGLIGVLTATMAMGAAVAGMGIFSSGVRQIASTAHHPGEAAVSRRALWTLSLLLALIGGVLFWLLREPVALAVMGDLKHADTFGWAGLGVSLTILAGAQGALVQGYRRMGDYARIQLYTNIAATVGIAAIAWLFQRAIIVAAVLCAPVAAALVGYWYARKVPRQSAARSEFRATIRIWRTLMGLGIAISVTAMLANATQMIARVIVVRQMGLDAAGMFQAAWNISAINITILLGAMAADYYPRLCGIADDRAVTTEVVNQQIRVALVLGGPALVALTCAAPLILHILYSSKFTEASFMLQWLLAADCLRLTGWALGYVMLARKAGFAYFTVEASFGVAFVPAVWLLAPRLGLYSVGVSYFLAYLLCLLVALFIARRRFGVAVSRTNVTWTALLSAFLLLLTLMYQINLIVAVLVGGAAVAALGVHSIREIGRMGIHIPVISGLVARVWPGS